MDKKIDIGEYTSLVVEVLEFVNSGKLLKNSNELSFGDDVVTDLSSAKYFAWDKLYGEDEFTWADLRSEKMAEVWDVIYSDEDRYSLIDNNISNIMDEISRTIQSQLNEQHKELLDDIVSDIKGCLYSRAVNGKRNAFFECILSIYRKGGWPCGWEGNWPNGKAIYYLNIK